MLNKIKFVFCLIIVIVILLTFSTRSIAASSLGEIISDGSNFINTGVNSNAILPTENSIKETSELLMNILPVASPLHKSGSGDCPGPDSMLQPCPP